MATRRTKAPNNSPLDVEQIQIVEIIAMAIGAPKLIA
jgi:hypothetical protein